jgi:hypothetical protein
MNKMIVNVKYVSIKIEELAEYDLRRPNWDENGKRGEDYNYAWHHVGGIWLLNPSFGTGHSIEDCISQVESQF